MTQAPMAQPTPSLNDLTEMVMALSGEQRRAIIVLATQAARKAVKRRIQAQGRVRPWWLVPQCEISKLAEAYLRQHPELLTDAMMSSIVRGMRPSRVPQQRKIHEGMGMAQ